MTRTRSKTGWVQRTDKPRETVLSLSLCECLRALGMHQRPGFQWRRWRSKLSDCYCRRLNGLPKCEQLAARWHQANGQISADAHKTQASLTSVTPVTSLPISTSSKLPMPTTGLSLDARGRSAILSLNRQSRRHDTLL